MIPKNHICFFVEEFVDSLDFSNFDLVYEGPGHPAYHPRILMKIIIQGMLCKERSSRKLSSACRENFVFMYLAEKVQPNFRTIARFRKENAEFIKETFKETINLASENNLVDLSLLCIDGSTIKANANMRRCLKKEQAEIFDTIIDKMIEEDIKQDEIEERLNREESLTEMDKRDLKKIVSEYRNAKNKTKVKEKCEKVKEEFEKDSKAKQIPLTDPDSRIMQNKKGLCELSYNAQFGVDSKHQIIVSNDICQDRHDAHQFIPQMRNIKENIELKEDAKVAVDCAYSEGENINFSETERIDLYVPSRAQAQEFDGKEESLNHDNYEFDEKKNELIVEGERYRYRGTYERKNGKKVITFYSEKLKKKREVPFFFRERLRMKVKMETEKAREIYDMRKYVIEPVIGNIKENFGFRQFLIRGLNGAKLELNLVSIAHNLKKIWRLRKRINQTYDSKIKNFDFCLIITKNYLNCRTA
jgi:transposase